MNTSLVTQYESVQAIKEQLLHKVSGISEEHLNRLPAGGGWSAGQVLYHCAYAESGTLLVIRKNMAENKVTRQSNLASAIRNLLLVISLRLPLKFKAPKQVSKVPEHITFTEIRDYFDKNSAEFNRILGALPTDLADKIIFRHPFGGDFNMEQTLRFTKEHYQHHERQLDALLGK